MRDCGDNHILVQQFKSLRFKEFKGAVIDKIRRPTQSTSIGT